jgi:hypothetical protein
VGPTCQVHLYSLHLHSPHLPLLFLLLVLTEADSAGGRSAAAGVLRHHSVLDERAGAALGELRQPLDPVGEREALQACSAPDG